MRIISESVLDAVCPK